MKFWNYDTHKSEQINLDAKTTKVVLRTTSDHECKEYAVTFDGYDNTGNHRHVVVTLIKTADQKFLHPTAATFTPVKRRGTDILIDAVEGLTDGMTQRGDYTAIRSAKRAIARFEKIHANPRYLTDEEQEEFELSDDFKYIQAISNISDHNARRYWRTILPDDEEKIVSMGY